MSFEPPAGILDIGNATLRVGKLEVAETSGLNQGLQNIIKNDLLITENNESSPYTTNQKWGIKLPTTWVGEFEVKGHTGKYIDFNFYNENSASNAQGYNLTFKDTTMTLRYDGGNPLGGGAATIPTIVGAFRKVNIFFERGVISVSIDGTRYLYHKETDGFNQGLGVASRVVSTTGSAFVNLFIESDHSNNSAFKNLRIVNGRFISDKTSNIAFIGGNLGVGVNSPQEALDIRGNMHFNRVSNVSSVSVDSNVVTEYTGPHDRPLRKYPEVALTANDNSSTSGYVADQTAFSGNVDGYAYRLFDHSLSTAYQSGGSQYSGGDSTSSAQTTTATDGTTHQGVAITLDLATKIRLSYAKITSHTYYGRTPVEGTFLGSNNNSTWDVIGTFAGLSTTASGQTHTVHIADYATKSVYRYIRLVVTKVHTSAVQNGGSLLEFKELEYYGHEEGDSSLDTTLKTVYNVPATTGTQLEVYYDAKNYTSGTITDESPNSYVGTLNSVTLDNSAIQSFDIPDGGNISATLTSIPSADFVHSVSVWVKFEGDTLTTSYPYLYFMGVNSAYSGFGLFCAGAARPNQLHVSCWTLDFPINFTFSNDTWHHVTYTYSGGGWSRNSTLNAYVDGIEYGFGDNWSTGTEGTTPTIATSNVPLRLGAVTTGGTFDGKIANFRLYSKALNADQVKELYDYQKDYFLGSKSQVTLYKGHLGVGVAEPSGQLELAGDERIQEYPPGPMSSNETLVEGHGAFVTHGGHINPAYAPWRAFNKELGSSGNFWIDTGIGYSDVAPYGPVSTHSKTTLYDGSVLLGGWIDLICPYPIKLSGVSIAPRTNYWQISLQRGVILGSNNGEDWYQIDTINYNSPSGSTGTTAISNQLTNFGLTSTSYYSHIRLVCTHLTSRYPASGTSDMHWQMGELVYFGTPGPTTLDKGSLTLGRSLDVPRVSRYDVDTETPRPEKLVVDYDTTVNDSPTDISGNANHGVFQGSTANGYKYSTADKAFSFASADDVIYVRLLSPAMTGDRICSMSAWFRTTNASSVNQTVMWLGAYSVSGLLTVAVSNGALRISIGDTCKMEVAGVIESNTWYHVVGIKAGTGAITSSNFSSTFKLYLNGKQLTGTFGGQTRTLNVTTNYWYVGAAGASGQEPFSGYISNPKLYDTILEPSEVRKLYRLGRTGRSMVISDTAVGIGKAPEAQLDVRGKLNVDGVITSNNPAFHVYRNAGDMTISNTTIVWNAVRFNRGNCYDSTSGNFHAPVSGMYHFSMFGMSDAVNDPVISFRFQYAPPAGTFDFIGALWPYQFTDGSGNMHGHCSGSFVYYLEAGSVFRVLFHGSEFLARGNAHNGYSGFLIG